MFSSADYFKAMGNRRFCLFSEDYMQSPTVMKVWELLKSDTLGMKVGPALLDVHNVDVETLKKIGIWDGLVPEVQKDVINGVNSKQEAIESRMSEMRSKRRQRYVNMPREIVCIECQGKASISPGVLLGRVDKYSKEKGTILSVEDYLKQYKCQKCNPTRGRKANPAYANFPKELVCKCGFKTKVNPTVLAKTVKDKGITVDEYVMRYQCRKCNPIKIWELRKKKGKKAKK